MKRPDGRMIMVEKDSMDGQDPKEENIRRLISNLNDPSIDIRHEAVLALGKIGKDAIGPLIQALAEAGTNDHRWYVAVALSGIGEPAVIPLISAMRVHKEIEFR